MKCEGKGCSAEAIWTIKWTDDPHVHHNTYYPSNAHILNVCQVCCHQLAALFDRNNVGYSITKIGKVERFVFR